MARGRVKKEPISAAPTAKGGRPSPVEDAVAAPEGTATLESVTQDSLDKLRHMQASISKKLARGEVTAAVAREAAGLARAIIALGAEMRQQAKALEHDAAHLSEEDEDEMVLEFILELPPRRRKRYADALLDKKRARTLLGQ